MKLVPKKYTRNFCKNNKCEKCGEEIIAVFRTWKPKKSRVSVEFVHKTKGNKSCFKTYNY